MKWARAHYIVEECLHGARWLAEPAGVSWRVHSAVSTCFSTIIDLFCNADNVMIFLPIPKYYRQIAWFLLESHTSDLADFS